MKHFNIHQNMNKQFYLFTLLFISTLSFSKNPIENFINNPLLENANISLLVRDLETNKTIYDIRSKNSIIPASTMKLITTATALELLGSNFCFDTKLEIDGKIDVDGVLNGNLYIRGGGDPTLGSEFLGNPDFLANWVEVIKNAGIKKINGKIIADATLYDAQGVNPKWTWEDMGNYYAAGSYGISYMDNTYKLVLRSGLVGTTPEIIKVIPKIQQLSFENHLKSTEIAFDSAYFYGAPHSNLRSIHGEIPANRLEFIIKGDIPNPGLLLAEHFHNKLIFSGITISELPTNVVTSNSERKMIYIQKSPPLTDIIKEINVHSNNGYAEQVFRYLSLKNSAVATSNVAKEVIKAFWKTKGFPVEQLFMYDGCGLAPEDAVSAQFFVDLLMYMKMQSPNKNTFFNSLPVSGESGTLTHFLEKTLLSGKVHAKSGTIARVKCYAGYVEWKEKKYIFAILVNNANGTSKAVNRKMEEFLLSLTEN